MDFSYREQVFDYVKSKYGSHIEYLWARFPHYAVFRHKDNRKWYGIVMDIHYSKVGSNKEGLVDVLNVKITDSALTDFLVHQDGFYYGYHQNRKTWVSIYLDGTVPIEQIYSLIDLSYDNTAPKNKQ